MRVCRTCQKDETEVQFYKKTICKSCNSEYMKDYRAKNRPKIAQQVQTWKDANREKYKSSCRSHHATVHGRAMHRARVERTPRSWLDKILSHCRIKTLRPGPHDSKDPIKRTFEIDLDYVMSLWSSQQGKCALSGLAMSHKFNDMCAASIDRKDSTRGYTKDNVQLVCQWVNKAKGNRSDTDMLAVLDRLPLRWPRFLPWVDRAAVLEGVVEAGAEIGWLCGRKLTMMVEWWPARVALQFTPDTVPDPVLAIIVAKDELTVQIYQQLREEPTEMELVEIETTWTDFADPGLFRSVAVKVKDLVGKHL